MTPEIVTEGSGWHEQVADRAEINVGYAGTGRDRSAAVAELARRVGAAEPAFGLRGVAVLHRRLYVHDEWRNNRLDDSGALEEVLTALGAGEPATLNGPSWSLTDPAAARRVAQERAVADAHDRAQGYATALGGTLGALLRLSEAADQGGGVRDMRMMTARAEAAPDVRELGLEPEPVRVGARCTTTWELVVRQR